MRGVIVRVQTTVQELLELHLDVRLSALLVMVPRQLSSVQTRAEVGPNLFHARVRRKVTHYQF